MPPQYNWCQACNGVVFADLFRSLSPKAGRFPDPRPPGSRLGHPGVMVLVSRTEGQLVRSWAQTGFTKTQLGGGHRK